MIDVFIIMSLCCENVTSVIKLTSNVTDDVHLSASSYLAAGIALGFIGFFGFTLNLIVIIVIAADAQTLWTPVNVILLNMAVGLFVSLVKIYILIVNYAKSARCSRYSGLIVHNIALKDN